MGFRPYGLVEIFANPKLFRVLGKVIGGLVILTGALLGGDALYNSQM